MHRGKLSALEGPADGRHTKNLFRGSRLRLPYIVGTLRPRAGSQFCVVAYQTRLFLVVVLAYWNYRCPGSNDNSGQLASRFTCFDSRTRTIKISAGGKVLATQTQKPRFQWRSEAP